MTSPKSSPNPHKASVPTPATKPEDSSKPVAVAAVPEISASLETTTENNEAPSGGGITLNGLAFPLALTILAIFPLAIGVGSVRLKAAASARANQIETNEVEVEEEPVAAPRPIDRNAGDRHFFDRRFDAALECYQTVANAKPDQPSVELKYRIGLCQEGLGQWNEAIASLGDVAASTENPVLKAAAVFGQARLHLQMNAPDKAANLLLSLELQQGSDRLLPRNLAQEIDFLFPIALTYDAILLDCRATQKKPDRISDLFIWSLESALKWSDESEQMAQGADASAPANQFLCRKMNKAKAAQPIEDVVIEVRCQGQSIKTFIERLATECGWTVDWSDLINDPSLGQIVNETAENRPVSLLLTAICTELKSAWSLDQNRLTIKRANAEGRPVRQMIQRTLESVMTWMPNHRHVNHCRFALAQLAQIEGDLPQAARLFSSLVGRDSSNLAVCAAFHAGTIYFQIGDLVRACTQLDFVTSGAPENEMHTAALILLGRILLDRGLTQDAVFQFRRAADARNQPNHQARAAAFLGMALMVQEKYQAAAEAILSHRHQFEEPAVHKAAALVTALVRWNALPEEMQESESRFLYSALMAVSSDPESFGQLFGQTGQLLIGRAYFELGFDNEMAELYTRMLSNGVTENIEMELMFYLAGYDDAQGRADSAITTWTKVADGPSDRWANRAKLRLAAVALDQGKYEDCLKLCESIQAGAGVLRSEVQKLMGKAYERLGDDVSAARCYAGQTPKH